MALEGVFPKVDGDIFYASEANRFSAGVSRNIIGSYGWVAGATVVGSIFWGPGSLSNPCKIYVVGAMQAQTANQRPILTLEISGASSNSSFICNNDQTVSGNMPFNAVFALGSPGSSFGCAIFQTVSNDMYARQSASMFGDFDSSLGTVLRFTLNFAIAGGSVGMTPVSVFAIKHSGTGF
jgi:hypothetical protein